MEAGEIFNCQSRNIWRSTRSSRFIYLKLFKAAAFRWLSHDRASAWLVSLFQAIIDSLDAFLNMKMIWYFFFLFFTSGRCDFSCKSSIKIFTNKYVWKCQQNSRCPKSYCHWWLRAIEKRALEFLSISRERNGRARRLRCSNLLHEEVTSEDRVEPFRNDAKAPFLDGLMTELNVGLRLMTKLYSRLMFLTLNPNWLKASHGKKSKFWMFFYGSLQSSLFEIERAKANPVVNIENSAIRGSVHYIHKDFKQTIKLLENEQQEDVARLVSSKSLAPNQVSVYRENHPLKVEQVYEKMCPDRQRYPEIMKLSNDLSL